MNMSHDAAIERMLEDAYAEFSSLMRQRKHKEALAIVRRLKDSGWEGNAQELWVRWWVSKEKVSLPKNAKVLLAKKSTKKPKKKRV